MFLASRCRRARAGVRFGGLARRRVLFFLDAARAFRFAIRFAIRSGVPRRRRAVVVRLLQRPAWLPGDRATHVAGAAALWAFGPPDVRVLHTLDDAGIVAGGALVRAREEGVGKRAVGEMGGRARLIMT